jgi:hypothetical protein
MGWIVIGNGIPFRMPTATADEVPAKALLNDDDEPILNDDGEYILTSD